MRAALIASGIALAMPMAFAVVPVATRADVPRRADAVACMALRETDETRAGNLPSMRAEPRADAPAVGVIGAVVFVPKPRRDRDGWTLVVRRDWIEGWVQSAWLQPYRVASDPRATCVPRLNPDGTLAWGPGR